MGVRRICWQLTSIRKIPEYMGSGEVYGYHCFYHSHSRTPYSVPVLSMEYYGVLMDVGLSYFILFILLYLFFIFYKLLLSTTWRADGQKWQLWEHFWPSTHQASLLPFPHSITHPAAAS